MSIPGSASPLFFTAAADAAAAGPIKSVRFNDADSAYLNRTPSSAGNRTTWTWTGWVKRGNSTNYPPLYSVNGEDFVLRFTNTDTLEIYSYGTGYNFRLLTTAVYRDSSAWYHILLAYDSTQATDSERISLYVNGSEVTSFSSTTWPSLNHQSGNSATAWHIGNLYNTYYFDGYLADVYFIDGQALDPTSFGAFDDNGVWQAAAYSGSFGTNGFHLFDFANESGIGNDSSGNDNDFTVNNIESGVYSGTKPKWYTSTTLYTTKADVIANATDRGQDAFTLSSEEFVYLVPNDGGVVGELCHPVGSEYPALFYVYVRSSGDTSWYNTGSHGVGEADTFQWENTTGTPQAYDYTNTEDLYLIGDTRTSGQPDANSKMSGSFPALVNLVGETDVLRDVPTNGDSSDDTGAGGEVSGNYCTWSPLAGTNVTLSNGNLDCSLSTGTASKARATIAVTSGKYYWEITFKSGQYGMIGISDASLRGSQISYAAGALNYYVQTGTLYGDVGGSFSDTSYGSALSADDVLGVALDMDNGNVRFIKNGSDTFGNANTSTLVGKTIMPHLGEAGGATFVTEANFGQRAFAYSAPSGYKALCTTNLPTPTIADGSDYFDTKLWTGNSSTNTISGLEFSPDWVWIKSRSNAVHHALLDTVRGTNNYLYSSLTNAEVSGYTDILTSFNSDGFTLGADSSNQVNYTGYTYVGWCWDAGSSTVSNTDGSITSSVRANQTAGFSIVSFTAGSTSSYTVGHGLNAKPHLMIFKDRDTSGQPWVIYHDSLGSSKYLLFSSATEASASWGGDPTSSVFYAGTTFFVDGADIIGYCFAPVAGYSAFGSYGGNGNADGPMVTTSFRPAFILTKGIDDAEDWYIRDTSRSPFNEVDKSLRPNDAGSEYSGRKIDILSNGFKIRDSDSQINENGKSYLYYAVAENPFQANGGLAR